MIPLGFCTTSKPGKQTWDKGDSGDVTFLEIKSVAAGARRDLSSALCKAPERRGDAWDVPCPKKVWQGHPTPCLPSTLVFIMCSQPGLAPGPARRQGSVAQVGMGCSGLKCNGAPGQSAWEGVPGGAGQTCLAHGCLRTLAFALGDQESQVGNRNELCRDAPGNPTNYLPASLHT